MSTNRINTKQVATKQYYSGNVYCVTVPDGEILVRSGLNSPIVVGNCQDISKMQWKLIDKVSANTKEMVVVSDRDQSLFCWGGAWPEGAEEWANRVGAEINILDQSYRVPFAPYMISVDILKSIKNRYDKTYKPTDQDGSVRRYNSIDNFDFNRVDSALILYRNHALRRKIEEELIRYNKPYTTLNGFPGLCDNKYGKAVAAWVNAKSTGQLNQHDARAIRAVATPAGMRVLCSNNVLDILDMSAMEVLLIPLNFIDYYRNVDFSKKNDIKMSTIHGAKGMEHDNVILVNGMTQRVLDGAIKDPDHELMVWYVAVTRTKSDLTIIDGEGVKGIL
jgi:superfamily I DNA/RNA helicase